MGEHEQLNDPSQTPLPDELLRPGDCQIIGHDLFAPTGFERLQCGRCQMPNPHGFKCRWVGIKCKEAPFPGCQFGRGCRDPNTGDPTP